MSTPKNISSLFKIEWDKVISQVQEISKLEKVSFTGGGWGGWSLTSNTGKFADGWEAGQLAFKRDEDGNIYKDEELAKKLGVQKHGAHNKYTEIATPELMSCVQQVAKYGLRPDRARITQLSPTQHAQWHTDGTPEIDTFRVHFVFETNPEAFFYTQAGTLHLESRQVYMV
jgi:hypothetical protein